MSSSDDVRQRDNMRHFQGKDAIGPVPNRDMWEVAARKRADEPAVAHAAHKFAAVHFGGDIHRAAACLDELAKRSASTGVRDEGAS